MNAENSTNSADGKDEKSFFGIIIHSFFVIPFLIAVFCVLLFTAVNLLTREQTTPFGLLENVKTGGLTKRWQAAFELSKVVLNPKTISDRKRFSAELIAAFKNSVHDDDRVRQYLALTMGRMGDADFFEPLTADIANEKEENLYAIIYALGLLKDPRAIPILSKHLDHPQARMRSATTVALGNIADQRAIPLLKKALNDPEANVQWGAAVSLALLKDASGKGSLKELLSRAYLEKFPEIDPQEQTNLLLMAIQAAKNLNDNELNQQLAVLAKTDTNMKVRAAAMQ